MQLPELTDEDSDEFNAGYKNICEFGEERIRGAGEKIKTESLAGTDYGFRVYRQDDNNMQDVFYRPQDYNQKNIDLYIDNIKPERSAEDLLTQVILDWGLPLSLPISSSEISGKKVYKVAGDSLYACFDRDIDEAFA